MFPIINSIIIYQIPCQSVIVTRRCQSFQLFKMLMSSKQRVLAQKAKWRFNYRSNLIFDMAHGTVIVNVVIRRHDFHFPRYKNCFVKQLISNCSKTADVLRFVSTRTASAVWLLLFKRLKKVTLYYNSNLLTYTSGHLLLELLYQRLPYKNITYLWLIMFYHFIE